MTGEVPRNTAASPSSRASTAVGALPRSQRPIRQPRWPILGLNASIHGGKLTETNPNGESRFMSLSRIAVVFVVLIGLAGHKAVAAEPSVPEFLPSYYAEALTAGGQDMVFISQGEKDGIKRASYRRTDDKVVVNINWLPCVRSQCDGIFTQNFQRFDIRLTSDGGRFLVATPVHFAAERNSPSAREIIFMAQLPEAIVSWTRDSVVSPGDTGDQDGDTTFIKAVESVLNRHRYEQARGLDNIAVGYWAPTIHRHAQDLLTRGRTAEAMSVLKRVIAWSPFNFEAQLEFAEHTSDAAAARDSAQTVWANAESQALIARAAKLLDKTPPNQASVPVLNGTHRGLRVVLVPLPPCDIRLVTQTARLFESSFDIPVVIARLPEPWRWSPPERLYQQVDMQRMIQQATPAVVDFSGWTRQRFAEELRAVASKGPALGQFQVEHYLDETADKPGQHDVDPHIERLIDALQPYRSDDRRTMFVGVTETDIYTGTANYVFSGGGSVNGNSASILSYNRMMAAMLGELYESRKRLVERLTKELVPAGLKLLDIPRPADPTDPYSYSNGVQRLNEKTLTLSEPTRKALDRFRDP